MFDTEKMILEMEQRPCLWNLSEKSYSDRLLKQVAWQEVAEKCFAEWNNLNNEEKGIKLDFLQKKWKSVRDYYIREKKKESEERSGSTAKRKKSCPYFDLLQFLKVTKHSKSSPSNAPSEYTIYINDSIVSGTNNDEDIKVEFEATEDLSSHQQIALQSHPIQTYQNQPSTSKQIIPPQPGSRTKNKNRSMTPFQKSILKKLDKNEDDRRNRHFLLSFLPEMSRMTERQNFEFRMDVMKALNKVKYQIPDQPSQAYFSSSYSDSQSSNQYFGTPIKREYTPQSNETDQSDDTSE